MSDLQVHGRPVMISITAVVTRADGTVEDLGAVSYWHRSPIRRWAWAIRRYLQGGG